MKVHCKQDKQSFYILGEKSRNCPIRGQKTSLSFKCYCLANLKSFAFRESRTKRFLSRLRLATARGVNKFAFSMRWHCGLQNIHEAERRREERNVSNKLQLTPGDNKFIIGIISVCHAQLMP